jgi:hypothetical protein
MADLESIQKKILSFRNERDWAQFHDPKNLAEALSIEAGELLENFLWKTTEQSRNLPPTELKNEKKELSDIFIFNEALDPMKLPCFVNSGANSWPENKILVEAL